MSTDPPDSDGKDSRRKSPRRRVLKAGIVAFNNRHSTLQCTIRDLSEGGARLMLSGSVDAPDTFELLIELDGIEANCRVVARKPGEVRVQFVGPVRRVEARRHQVIKPTTPAKPVTLRRQPRPGEKI